MTRKVVGTQEIMLPSSRLWRRVLSRWLRKLCGNSASIFRVEVNQVVKMASTQDRWRKGHWGEEWPTKA